MSINNVITKLVTDEEFMQEYLNNPEQAIEGFDLSEEDKAELLSVDMSELVELNSELEERLSKSFVNLPSIQGDDNDWHSSTHSDHSSESTAHSSNSGSGW